MVPDFLASTARLVLVKNYAESWVGISRLAVDHSMFPSGHRPSKAYDGVDEEPCRHVSANFTRYDTCVLGPGPFMTD